MQLDIVVCTLNSVALFWLLFEYIDIGLRYKNWRKIEVFEVVKPFDCTFCMMFWCSLISVASYLLLPTVCNGLILLSLPITLAYLINKIQ